MARCEIQPAPVIVKLLGCEDSGDGGVCVWGLPEPEIPLALDLIGI